MNTKRKIEKRGETIRIKMTQGTFKRTKLKVVKNRNGKF